MFFKISTYSLDSIKVNNVSILVYAIQLQIKYTEYRIILAINIFYNLTLSRYLFKNYFIIKNIIIKRIE